MPFDANLVLADSTLDWTKANIDNYGAVVDTNRNTGGFVVIDMLELGGTAARGMAAILIADSGDAGDTDALTVIIQSSNQLDYVVDSENDVRTEATFDILGTAPGVIVGTEAPFTVVRRFATNQRYIRAKVTLTDADDFKTCWVLLAPWPFITL